MNKSESFQSNTDHVISKKLDTDPDFYKVIMVNNRNEALRYLKRGSRLSISINMENYNIYVGGNHLEMQIENRIPYDNFCAGYVYFDKNTGKAVVEDFTDWREGMDNAHSVKRTIEQAFDRDIGKLIV